ncbi:MAG: type 4a pilus biogenesis protein PilO [Burkholderiaceae bacterium]|jgi:type IV pilus assembly protein PilO|nr:type 4a pilus biogenesis protein PilO [Burkholderiaceae bacterium]
MATKVNIASLREQFRIVDRRSPWTWPALPRYILLLAVAALVVGLVWYVVFSDDMTQLERERQTEVTLRADFQKKVQQAASLEDLKKQKEQVMQYVALLEKQLPGKAEMDVLLSDINQAGLGRSLQFEVFRPGQEVAREYYVEKPITLKVTGRYHDIGAFVADIAALSRIVTLNNVDIKPANSKDARGGGIMVLDAIAKTFRYLDESEIEAQRRATSGKKK